MTTSIINPAWIDMQFTADGYIHDPEGEAMFGEDFPDHLLIGEGKLTDSQFVNACREIIEENRKLGIRGRNYVRPLNNQAPESSCVYNATEAAWRGTWNQVWGNEWEIKASPMSGYCHATRSRRSGSTMWGALLHMQEIGLLPEDNEKNRKLFKHLCHQNTPFIQRERLPEGYRTTARHIRVREWLKITSGQAYMSAIVKHRYFVVMGRSSHSMVAIDGAWDNGLFAEICDSYGPQRGDGGYVYDSWRTVCRSTGGAWACRDIYLPDDPAYPAGKDGLILPPHLRN